jgi:hypothetical protein
MQADKKHWLDDKGNVDKIFYALCAICAGLFLADAFYVKHAHFESEGAFGFYAVFGFVACVLLVLAAKHVLRTIVRRDEDYYDR